MGMQRYASSSNSAQKAQTDETELHAVSSLGTRVAVASGERKCESSVMRRPHAPALAHSVVCSAERVAR